MKKVMFINSALKTVFGKASSADARLAALMSHLEKDGDDYKNRQLTAYEHMGRIMADLVTYERGLTDAGLIGRMVTTLRKKLSKHSGHGERRKDKRQTFISLALEYFYGQRRNTRSRWNKAISRLKREKIEPKKFGAAIKQAGGIDEYVAGKREILDQLGADHVADHFIPPRKTAKAAGITMTRSSHLEAGLRGLKDGYHVIVMGIQKNGDVMEELFFSRDPVVCGSAYRLSQTSGLQLTCGIVPKTKKPILKKIPSIEDVMAIQH